MRRLLKKGGKLALLNPSENLSVETAAAFVQLRGLQGLARDTLLGWAKRAEEYQRWSEEETESLYQQAGFKYMASIVQVGPGFARCSWGTA